MTCKSDRFNHLQIMILWNHHLFPEGLNKGIEKYKYWVLCWDFWLKGSMVTESGTRYGRVSLGEDETQNWNKTCGIFFLACPVCHFPCAKRFEVLQVIWWREAIVVYWTNYINHELSSTLLDFWFPCARKPHRRDELHVHRFSQGSRRTLTGDDLNLHGNRCR